VLLHEFLFFDNTRNKPSETEDTDMFFIDVKDIENQDNKYMYKTVVFTKDTIQANKDLLGQNEGNQLLLSFIYIKCCEYILYTICREFHQADSSLWQEVDEPNPMLM